MTISGHHQTPIAVVIPCYNLGRFVEEAVGSVVAQTRPPDQIVIVDDGSTDPDTCGVLGALERSGTRIVHTRTQGLAAARNHGVGLTSAPYLVTLDADDALEPTYLELAAARLDADQEVDFVTAAIQAFGDASYVWTPSACDIATALTRGGPHPATMFRRCVWEAVGGFHHVSDGGLEDLDFWIAAMRRGFRGAILSTPLIRSRVYADSRHHDAVERGTYRVAVETLLRKYRGIVEELGPDLLIRKESFLLELREYQRGLEAKRNALAADLRALEAELADPSAGPAARERGVVGFGDLRRLEPISQVWGVDRGTPIDRHYIEAFLAEHRPDIRGRVLEVKDPGYTVRFGGDAVTSREVLDIDPTNPQATIVSDLSRATRIAAESFDCFILTQTLHRIYDVRGALAHAGRILRPGGVLLCTVPAVSRLDSDDGQTDSGDCWRFTEASVGRLFAEVFPVDNVDVTVHGNVLTCAAFLYGFSSEELTADELAHVDRRFPLLFCVRAVKPSRRFT